MKKYAITYYDGNNVCFYTGDEQYPFYYLGEPFRFNDRRKARAILKDIQAKYWWAKNNRDFQIIEI